MVDTSSASVSVIIPVYNVERYLRKCIDSVVNQSFRDLEIIIVNDGSTDKSANIIKEYKEKYPGIIKDLYKENGGLSSARNYAIENVQGEYITFLDSDDYLDYDYIETLYNVAKQSNSDMVCGGQKKVDQEGKILARLQYPLNKNPNTILRRLNISGKLYKREYVEKYNMRFAEGKTYEDDPFNLFMIFMAKNLKLVPYEGYNQLVREGSITSNKIESSKIPYEALEYTIKYISENKQSCNNYSVFEYTVMSFFAYFIFQANKSHAYLVQGKERKSDCSAVLDFCDFTLEILEKYMPRYYKNGNLPLWKNKDLQLKQRIGTLGYAIMSKTKVLKLIVKIYYKF
jgi:glycosyltransferase involved in cell wall biosynthesis